MLAVRHRLPPIDVGETAQALAIVDSLLIACQRGEPPPASNRTPFNSCILLCKTDLEC